MKIKEVSEKFDVSMTTLRYYEKVGLFDDVQRVNNIREYRDEDIQRLSTIVTLKKAGIHIEAILKFIQLKKEKRDTFKERVCLLKKQRSETLDMIHLHQKNLDTLDCMIYHMNNKEDIL